MSVVPFLPHGKVPQPDSAARPASRRTTSTVPKAGAIGIPTGIAYNVGFSDGCILEDGVTRVGRSERPCLPCGAIESSVGSISSQIDLDEQIHWNPDCHKRAIDQTCPTA